jgi:hypothetical protein
MSKVENRMTSKSTKTEAVIQLRDHAMAILQRHGKLEPVRNGLNILMWSDDSFRIMLRTPFQKSPVPDDPAKFLAAKLGVPIEQAKYLAAQHGIKLLGALPYCIDIAQGWKVFSMEWADDGRTCIVSFKRGEWEAEFLALEC